jgi:hypothetical protein
MENFPIFNLNPIAPSPLAQPACRHPGPKNQLSRQPQFWESQRPNQIAPTPHLPPECPKGRCRTLSAVARSGRVLS